MASVQAIANEAITKTVVEAIRAAIQTMAAAMAERPQSTAGPKIDRPLHGRKSKSEMGNKWNGECKVGIQCLLIRKK